MQSKKIKDPCVMTKLAIKSGSRSWYGGFNRSNNSGKAL